MSFDPFGRRRSPRLNPSGFHALIPPQISPTDFHDLETYFFQGQSMQFMAPTPKVNKERMEESSARYDSIKNAVNPFTNEQSDRNDSVKGGAGSGYRMVLENPVNKTMLSCHQCKNKQSLDRIIVCGHVYKINKTVKTCTKKYCKACLLRFYIEVAPTDDKAPSWSNWKCPCCRYICCCAQCRKKKQKRMQCVTQAVKTEAHRLTPAVSLARKLVNEAIAEKNTTAPRTDLIFGSSAPIQDESFNLDQ